MSDKLQFVDGTPSMVLPYFETHMEVKTIHEGAPKGYFMPISCDFVDRSCSRRGNTKSDQGTTLSIGAWISTHPFMLGGTDLITPTVVATQFPAIDS